MKNVDICVIYGSADQRIVEALVLLLRQHWSVWWAGDIHKGDWEAAVKKAINGARVVIPVISKDSAAKPIFRDELQIAARNHDPFLFVIEECDVPLGFGHLHRTDAYGWDGNETNKGYKSLCDKLRTELGRNPLAERSKARKSTLQFGRKSVDLPCFALSLSSYETQLHPKDGVELFQIVQPPLVLLSAYDVYKLRGDRRFLKVLRNLSGTNSVLFLDSGNYEASRREDRYSIRTNRDGWNRKRFDDAVLLTRPDLVFTFDNPDRKGTAKEITRATINEYVRETRKFKSAEPTICPIAHLPNKHANDIGKCAAKIIRDVVNATDPFMVAIPERELGDGILARAKAVRLIRQELDKVGKYCALHLLGTGNPISTVVLAAAGADSFDGLEWCRTVADYSSGNLFHFQHFDFFKNTGIGRVQSSLVRELVNSADIPYSMKVASFNLDFYLDWMKTMQDMIQSGKGKHLLKTVVPNYADDLFRDVAE